MPTIRLIPSAYTLSNTTYLKITNPTNMYTNTDSTTYATVANSQTGTTSYYLYIKGFNFSAVPSNAVVSSFTVKLKIRETGGTTTSSSTYLTLSNNTTAINGTPSSGMGTTDKVITFTTTVAWNTIKGYGANFGIRVNCRRNNRNTAASFYISGAEILVDYTLPTFNVTSSLTTSGGASGTINPSGTSSIIQGESYNLTIIPSSKDYKVTLTDNGVDKTSSLVKHTASGGTFTSVISKYTLQSGSIGTQTFFSNAVGNGYDTTQRQTGNGYSSSSGSTATVRYDFDFSDLPSNIIIDAVRIKVRGHAESSSNANEHNDCTIMVGSTAESDMQSFKPTGTTNTVLTLTAYSGIDEQDVRSMWLQVVVGYYGGAIDGATVEVDYRPNAEIYYEYTLTNITAAHTLNVTISPGITLYSKDGTGWVAYSKAYKKVNGVWVLQSDLTTVFDSTVVYVKG